MDVELPPNAEPIAAPRAVHPEFRLRSLYTLLLSLALTAGENDLVASALLPLFDTQPNQLVIISLLGAAWKLGARKLAAILGELTRRWPVPSFLETFRPLFETAPLHLVMNRTPPPEPPLAPVFIRLQLDVMNHRNNIVAETRKSQTHPTTLHHQLLPFLASTCDLSDVIAMCERASRSLEAAAEREAAADVSNAGVGRVYDFVARAERKDV
jgi:hypothetical protein